MYSEFEIKRQIDIIANGDDTPLRKARRLIHLSRNIRRFAHKMDHGAVILRGDDDEGAERMKQTQNCLKRMQEEARLAAFKALKSTPAVNVLSFQVKPEPQAYPTRWQDTKEHLDTQPSYN
jgi:hypothetical protein